MGTTTKSWQIQGSGKKPYEILLHDDGHLSCGCPGWVFKRDNQARHCKHTKQIAAQERFALQERDGIMYVVGSVDPSKALAAAAPSFKADAKAAAKVAAALVDAFKARERTTCGDCGKAFDTTIQATVHMRATGHATSDVQAVIHAAHEDENSVTIEASSDGTQRVIAASGFIEPMLASKMPDGYTADSYDATDYVMEEKYDGHRMVVRVSDDGTVRAWSRQNNVRTLPDHIVKVISQAVDGVYDGELIVPGNKSYGVTAGSNAGTEVLVLFDMIEAIGQRIGADQEERRRFLVNATKNIKTSKSVVLSRQMKPSQAAVDEIWARGGEGAIIKAKAALYRPGVRTPEWVKVKAVAQATLTVTGFTEGKSGPYSTVDLVDPVSGIETSVKTLDNATMRAIARNPKALIGARLVIQYQERTPDGKYRHPMFDHWATAAE